MRALDARNGLLGVISSDGSSRFPPLFSLLMPVFRGRNQRFIKKCTLRWTITGYLSSKVSQNNTLATLRFETYIRKCARRKFTE